jgi:ketosteroid isomerase-like protein
MGIGQLDRELGKAHWIVGEWEPMGTQWRYVPRHRERQVMSEIDTPKGRLEFVFSETGIGNWQPFVDALADDAEWTVIGSTGWSKSYRGKPQILSDLFAPLRRVLAPPRKSHALYMIAEGNMVAVQGQGENTTRDGRRYSNTYCWIFTFRGGQVRAITEYADTELMRSVLGEPPQHAAETPRRTGVALP